MPNAQIAFPPVWGATVGAEYHLKAVIVHHDNESFGGHYTAYCWDALGVWYSSDDAREPCLVCITEVTKW